MRKYLIIGDIHGEIRLLEKLLKAVESERPDKLVFTGDYIDRGPHSKLVIDKLLSMDTETVCLMGNHEWMLLNAIENTAYGYSPLELWYYNGAEATLRSFEFDNFFSFKSGLDIQYLNFFRSLPVNHILQTGSGVDILVTHAGISPEIPLSDQLEMKHYKDLHTYLLKHHIDPGDSFLWVRDQFFNADPERWKNFMVVHGHTPVDKLRRFADCEDPGVWQFYHSDICIRRDKSSGVPVSIDIDSGSMISGRLSALEIKDHHGTLHLKGITVSGDEIVRRDIGKF